MNRILQARTSVPRFWLFALVLWLGISAVSFAILWRLHSDALDGQSREIDLLSLALTDEMDRGLHGVEDGLNTVRIGIRTGRVMASGTDAGQTLSTLARLMPLVRTLWLVGPDGKVLSASDDSPAPDLRSFLPVPEEKDDDTPAMSPPFPSADARESLVALAVRFDGKSGNAGGWAVASLPATSLLGAFSTASPVTDARMAVFRNDGVRLAGSLIDAPPRGRPPTALLVANRPSIYLHRFHDGSERLVSQHDLTRYGLVMILTRDIAVALATWRDTAQIMVAGIALLLVILMASVFLIVRADRRHADAQHALQVQRSRASKLESLGTLAGGVAHDFNNILAAILGFVEMAQDAAAPASNQARHLDKVLQAALRGKALAERILIFSRGGGRSMTVFALEPVVEEVLTLLAASLRPNVTLERRLEAPNARLRGDPTQAFEALMNLCTNAMQAMAEHGGTVCIRLKRVHVAVANVLSHSQLAPGNYLLLSVSDQGAGISSEVMERLFEPFFTTRTTPSGTGLGLAIVHGVVAEFGGAIDVQSTLGHGSCFSLYFPECTEALSVATTPGSTAMEGAGQCLMVVDDDATLVSLVEETLKGLGYESVGFSEPVVALEAFRHDPRRFAAVITDEVMPGLCGTQFTKALRLVAPNMPVLLLSGFGGALLASRACAAGVTRVLAKPLQRAELARVLNEILH